MEDNNDYVKVNNPQKLRIGIIQHNANGSISMGQAQNGTQNNTIIRQLQG